VQSEIEYPALQPQGVAVDAGADLGRLADVPVELAVELGRTRMTIEQTLELGPGSVVSLNRLAGEPVDLLVNGKPIARGEVVVIDEEFGLRITDVSSGARRLVGGPAAVVAATPAARAPGPAPQPAAPVAGHQVAAYLGGSPAEEAPASVEAAAAPGAEAGDIAAHLDGEAAATPGIGSDDEIAAYLNGSADSPQG